MEKEVCRNPLKPDCGRTDIQLYIQIGSDKLPICSGCWADIANGNIEWNEKGFRVNGERLKAKDLKSYRIEEKAVTKKKLKTKRMPNF